MSWLKLHSLTSNTLFLLFVTERGHVLSFFALKRGPLHVLNKCIFDDQKRSYHSFLHHFTSTICFHNVLQPLYSYPVFSPNINNFLRFFSYLYFKEWHALSLLEDIFMIAIRLERYSLQLSKILVLQSYQTSFQSISRSSRSLSRALSRVLHPGCFYEVTTFSRCYLL